MVSALMTVQDGAGVPVATTNGQALQLTPGSLITVSLTTTTGVSLWAVQAQGCDYLPLVPLAYSTPTGGNLAVFSFSFALPQTPCSLQLFSEASDGTNMVTSFVSISSSALTTEVEHSALGVVVGNVASLAAFTVAGNDGLTYTQGQRALLVGQTTKSQNGVYVVGAVSAGTAPLTRAADWASGAVLPAAMVVEVNRGTNFGQSTWKVTTSGAITVGTTAFDMYPRSVTLPIVLVAGTLGAAISIVPILSASTTSFYFTRKVAGATANTVMYTVTPTATAGISGTASALPIAALADGTINVADVSTLNFTIQNW